MERERHRCVARTRLRLDYLEARHLLATNVLLDFGTALAGDTMHFANNFHGLPLAATVEAFTRYNFDNTGGANTPTALRDAVLPLVQDMLEPFDIVVATVAATVTSEVSAFLANGVPESDGTSNDTYVFVGAVSESDVAPDNCGFTGKDTSMENDNVAVIVLEHTDVEPFETDAGLYHTLYNSPEGPGTYSAEFSRRFAQATANVIVHELVHAVIGGDDPSTSALPLPNATNALYDIGTVGGPVTLVADDSVITGLMGFDQICVDDDLTAPNLGLDALMFYRFRTSTTGLDGDLYFSGFPDPDPNAEVRHSEYDQMVAGSGANGGYVGGTGLDDDIDISLSGGQIVVNVDPDAPGFGSGLPIGNPVSNITSYTYTLGAPSQFQTIFVFTGAGNDKVTISSAISGVEFVIRGAGGDDELEGGVEADDLYGGSGQDTFNVRGVPTENEPMDKIVDNIIRNENGIGDFDDDLEGDANKLEFELAGYVDIALSYVSPEQDAGTLNFKVNGDQGDNTKLMAAAIEELFRLSNTGETNDDFDFDGTAGISSTGSLTSDLGILITEVIGTLFGDIDLDGRVNGADLNVIGGNWQMMGVVADFWDVGDLNGDGTVDAQDLNLLGQNWQQNNGNWQ